MRILALESANDHCSVAIIEKNEILFFKHDKRSKMQTQVILPMIEQALIETQSQWHQFSAIAFSRGPGAFSGVRINATVAQALAWANQLPVISISSLQALAFKAMQQLSLSEVTTVLDARMQEVYIANYQLKQNGYHTVAAIDNEQLLGYEAAKQVCQFTAVGSGAHLIQSSELAHTQIYADARDIAFLAESVPRDHWLTADQALPVYLRNDAWKKIAEQK